MESNGFEAFENAWKKTREIKSPISNYSLKELKTLKMKNSASFHMSLRRTIVFDIIQKAFLVVALLGIIWLFVANTTLIVVLIMVASAAVFMVVIERQYLQQFDKARDYPTNLKDTIISQIAFFHRKFPLLRLIIAFSSGILVWTGSLYYQFIKYGKQANFALEDSIVLLIMVILAVAVSYFAYGLPFQVHIRSLEEDLAVLKDDKNVSDYLTKQNQRKKRLKVLLIGLLIVGTISLAIFVLIYFLR